MSSKVKAILDPSHDVLRYERRALDPIFQPRSVAVVGATKSAGSVGRTILWNLISNPFGGVVYPVNPKRPSVLGIKAYRESGGRAREGGPGRHSSRRPQPCRASSASAWRLAWAAQLIISAGFREIGEKGVELERRFWPRQRRSQACGSSAPTAWA